ncbi:MAG TPA: nitric-oxide reductase large subunit [Gammaproteobacteria bacterium]|nr:nitric-oxide reductase large subunit [Gammaproteobacteria bacterium]
MMAYDTVFSIRRLWMIFAASMVVMFGTLLYFGGQIYHAAPPIPAAVRAAAGQTLFTRADIERGQNVWQSIGGMQQGSIWGHGSYVAPDWSADWLHREAVALLDLLARNDGAASYAALAAPEQARIRAILTQAMRTNTYDAATQVVTVGDDRARAIAAVALHYSALFQDGSAEARALREQYAFPIDAVLSADEAAALNAFFFWTAWAASTERPGQSITYTSNWPHEPLVGNTPTGAVFMWTFISIFVLLAGIGTLVWYYAKEFDLWRRDGEPESGFARQDFMKAIAVTPSMRATSWYFMIVTLLFAAQVVLGVVTAHYAVEGQGLYGLPLSEYFPYSVTRTWHTQLAVLWIAAAWLATGLYVAPMLGGREPKLQAAGVWFLLVSLVVIVAGSFAGEWLAINRLIGDAARNFWFGHQGYEYVDLGRFWQIYLFVGLLLWVVLVLRGLKPALSSRQSRSLLFLVVVATVAIGLLFGAGLLYGRNTHISIMEYWRWWVVHLWVEGVFEVFATAIVSALLVRMGLVRTSVATTSVLVATIIFLGGGVLGTFHHLYWSGTPVGVLALGSVFSALEVVPLVVVGFEAYSRAKHEGLFDWQTAYRWPFMFFGAVLVWNLIGAGLFGFLINPPLALYYMQGLNTTPTHGHAALFGVYGMLGLGLMLFCMRGLTDVTRWSERLLATSFWCLNIGLAMMVFLSLLPQGLYQAYWSFTRDYAYARSAEVIHGPVMQALVWARVPGDVVFAVGVFAFAAFVARAFAATRTPRAATGGTYVPT